MALRFRKTGYGLVALLVVTIGARAAMGIIPFDKLVLGADLIVFGTILSVGPASKDYASPAGGSQHPEYSLSSVAELEVKNAIKGESTPRHLSIKFSSGEDSPNYKRGEHVVSFLKHDPDQKHYITVGMIQGKYLIREGVVERLNIPTNEFVNRIKDLMTVPQG